MRNADYYLGLNYRTSVYRDDEGDFIVEVPDLPGCAADGKTPSEAFLNLNSAMRSWIESRLAAGLRVPEPRPVEFSGKLVVRMPKSLHQRLSVQADEDGVSLNQYIVSLLSTASGDIMTGNSTVQAVAPIRYVAYASEPVSNVSALVSVSGNLLGADKYDLGITENNVFVGRGLGWNQGWDAIIGSPCKITTANPLGSIEENWIRPIPERKTRVA